MATESLTFSQALNVLRRRALLVVFCAAVVAGAAFAYSESQQKEYTATASLVFTKDSLASQITGLTPLSSGAQLAAQQSNVELVKLGNMAATTAEQLGEGLTEAAVRSSVKVKGQAESNVVLVQATSPSPQRSAAMATVYAHQFVVSRRAENKQFFESALRLVEGEIERLPESQRFGPAAVELQTRAQDLRLLEGLGYADVQIAQKAVVPPSASSPNTKKNVVVGALLGLLLGIGLAFVLERLDRDRRLRTGEDLEDAYRLPVLGAVPESGELAKAARQGRGDGPWPAEAEAFNLIRARLRFASVGRVTPRALVVATAARGDGATTVARGLAEATAAVGARVLLIEADFRAPSLAKSLGLSARAGLSEVLSGAADLGEAIQQVSLGKLSADGKVRALDILLAGIKAPLNPAELLESEAMEATLTYARSSYDLVVVDAPPLTEVSDGYSLLGKVDGVLVVSWLGRSRRDAAARLQRALVSSGASQLGVIANRVRRRDLHTFAAAPTRAVEPDPVQPSPA